MRYYAIKLINPDTGSIVTFSDTSNKFVDNPSAKATWTSHDAAGNFLPQALNVELDIPALPFGASQGGLAVRVWGVGLPALSQASDLAGYNIEIDGGMRTPYNLNKAAAPGVLAVGQVFQGFGNWEGVAQHLDLVVFSQAAGPDLDAAIAFTWPSGQDLATAITNALTAAFPGFSVQAQVQRLVQDHDESGFYTSIKAFAEYVLEITEAGTYTGINIRSVGSVFYLYDNAAPATPLQLKFEDLIGQPTWISPSTITFATVMRADIQLGQAVQFPTGLFPPYVLTTPQAAVPNAPSSSRSAFQGTFNVIEVHHYGNFRQADAESWRTVYVAVVNDAQPNLIAGEPVIPEGTA